MQDKVNIASVKKIPEKLKNKLQAIGIRLYDADFLNYKYTQNIPAIEGEVVFTSQHAVRAYADIHQANSDAFVINKATLQEAVNAGWHIAESAENATLLAEKIITHGTKKVTHLCGNIRRKELKKILTKAGVEIIEIEVYQKELLNIRLNETIDGLMIYSPSGLDAFLQNNELKKNHPVFCIGTTTAIYTKQLGYENIQVAEEATMEAVINKVIEYYK